jgi:hypothetical protein
MKAWYDDIDGATLQRIKTYSAFNDAKSKNLMVQTMYEYREKEIQDFKETNHELAETCIERKNRIAELEAQIEKLIDFAVSRTECCDVCPITDTCINSEGVCTYAGILAKSEEEVTKEWLMQFISKEVKEK